MYLSFQSFNSIFWITQIFIIYFTKNLIKKIIKFVFVKEYFSSLYYQTQNTLRIEFSKGKMDRFQHKMRTTQHAKSVQMIMTRTNCQFFDTKSPRKRPSPQGDNITTYLRKFQIQKQNLNLAKRIMQCQSEHSKLKYGKEWQNVKRFLRVRSNFKKTLHAKQPIIYRFEQILGKGKLKIDFQIKEAQILNSCISKKSLYRFSFILGNNEIEPDKKLITSEFIQSYATCFYAPLFLKKKIITCKICQIHENSNYQIGRFQIDLKQTQIQEVDILNRTGKNIGKVKFNIRVEGGRKKIKRKIKQNQQNQQNLDKLEVLNYRQNNLSNLQL